MISAAHSFLFFLLLLLSACSPVTQILETTVKTIPVYNVAPEKMIIINTFDVASQNYRENKEALFVSLIDSALIILSRDIAKRSGILAKPLLGVTQAGKTVSYRDSLTHQLMLDNQASDAIAITSFNIYFDQTNVEVTEDESGGKSREAYYDLVSDIDYNWYDHDGVFQSTKVEIRQFHSSRFVLSGVFAAGPNIVSQKEEALKMIESNLMRYLNHFFPGYEKRMRPVFVGKEFTIVKASINAGDFEKALTESIRLTKNADKQVAAQANYNCAVLLEFLNRPTDVRAYLEESQRLHNLYPTFEMMKDY